MFFLVEHHRAPVGSFLQPVQDGSPALVCMDSHPQRSVTFRLEESVLLTSSRLLIMMIRKG